MTVLEQRFLELGSQYFNKQSHKEIDWEQRRYEIAREIHAQYAQAQWYTGSEENSAKDSVRWADALIAELKKEKE